MDNEKPNAAKDRKRQDPLTLLEYKKKVRGRDESGNTPIPLPPSTVKAILNEQATNVERLEEAVTDPLLDKMLVMPVVEKTKMGEINVNLVPQRPPPIYYQKHSNRILTLNRCRWCLVFSNLFIIMISMISIGCLIYYDYYYPFEFHRILIVHESSELVRSVLELHFGIYLTYFSLAFGLMGFIMASTLRSYIIVGFYLTYLPIFGIPYLFFVGAQIYSLTLLSEPILRNILFNTLSGYRYGKVQRKEVDMAWDRAQQLLECCGVDSYEDWWNADWHYWTGREDAPPKTSAKYGRYPESCCNGYDFELSWGLYERSRNYAIQMLHCQFHPDNYHLHSTSGCYHKLLNFYLKYTTLLLVFAIFSILTFSVSGWMAYFYYYRLREKENKGGEEFKGSVKHWLSHYLILIPIFCEVKKKSVRRRKKKRCKYHFEPRPPPGYLNIGNSRIGPTLNREFLVRKVPQYPDADEDEILQHQAISSVN